MPHRFHRRHRWAALLVLGVLVGTGIARPAGAGVVYVPAAVHEIQGNVVIRTEVWATNPSMSEVLGFFSLFLPSLQDGTQREGERPVHFVGPGQSVRFSNLVPPGQRGMLELEGSPDLLLSARLVVDVIGQDGEPEPEEIPLIGSAERLAANSEAWIQALGKNGNQRYANVGLLNLGHEPATCRVDLRRADGLLLVQNVEARLPALSHVQFDDAFSLLQLTNVADGAWLKWTCDQPFWAYGSLYNLNNRSTQFMKPSIQPKKSSLLKPGEVIIDEPEVVYELPGTYLISGPNNHDWFFYMPAVHGRVFRKIKMQFDVYVGGWDPNIPNGFHCLFWLQNNFFRWDLMLGYLNSRGTQNTMVFQVNYTGYGDIERYQGPGLQIGGTYRVFYEYNAPEGFVAYAIYQGSNYVTGVSYPLEVASVAMTNDVFISFGTQIADGPEARTYGWRFSDFKIEWFE